MLTRRQLLHRGAVGGAGLMLPTALLQSSAIAAAPGIAPYQANLLHYIPPIVPVADGGTVELAIRQVQRLVAPKAKPTTVWSYELARNDPRADGAAGSWIGPILALNASSAITVKYAVDGAISQHLLAASIDKTVLDPYVVDAKAPDTRFMTHLHGSFVDGANDGNPFATHHADEWRPGQTETKVYAAQDRAALIWYHQHAHGITHLNVYAGLAGGYLLRDGIDTGLNDNPLGLPANADAAGNPIGLYEVPLVIQDRMFAANALRTALDLFYPPAPWVPEFFGDTMCVNGAVEPFMAVEPRLYRFRIINGCNARFINLDWKPSSLTLTQPPMHVIGSDGGLLPTPSTQPTLVIAPGERYDIVVDFTGLAGETVNLANKAPFPAPVVNPASPLTRIMQFRVTTPLNPANQPTATFNPAATLTTDTPAAALPGATNTRYHSFEEVMGMAGPLGAVINGKTFEGRYVKNPQPATGYPFDVNNPADVQETPANGSTEDWVFANATADTHPLHMHLVQFGVIERLPFNVVGYLTALAAARAGAPQPNSPLLPNDTIDPTPFILAGAVGTPVLASEKGWKDTVQMHPGEVTRIRAKFDLKTNFTPSQDYVFHCHILEHESNSMMRPFRVVT